MSQEEEKIPVDESLQVMSYKTIYKTKKWWCAVVLVNAFGHNQILIYQWIWNDKVGKWKRKQKFSINYDNNWTAIKSAIEEYLPKLGGIGSGQ